MTSHDYWEPLLLPTRLEQNQGQSNYIVDDGSWNAYKRVLSDQFENNS